MSRWMRLWLALPGLVVVIGAAWIAVQPDPQRSERLAIDRLWRDGRWTEARQQLLATTHTPDGTNFVRLALIELLRGDCPTAQNYSADAFRSVLRRDDAALAHLIVGRCAALRGDRDRAEAEWRSLDPRSPYAALPSLLRAEQALADGALVDAASHYRAVITGPLPDPWIALARFRLALLLAADHPDEAQQLLAAMPETLPPAAADLRPFLPLPEKEILARSQQLAAILTTDQATWPQALGQQALELGLLRLAITRFERNAPITTDGLRSHAYAAYARWQLGQTDAARRQWGELWHAAPSDPLIATLYATTALHNNELDAAEQSLRAAESHSPLDPAIALVRSDLRAARHDYPGAINEARRARDLAQAEQRGRYALALARQHLSLTYRLCDDGIAAAREATMIAPDLPATWQALAESTYHCAAYTDAAAAAEHGLQHAPNDPALHFLLGAALWEQGQHTAAQPHLIAAADLAPTSEWRERAEDRLGWA